MNTRLIDPRDITWEADQRVYRVYFDNEDRSTQEWEISEADLSQALAWISENSHGRAYSLYACIERDQQHGLLHLTSKHSQTEP